MRGPSRESELVEAPPHRAEIRSSSVPCRPLPASGARNAVCLQEPLAQPRDHVRDAGPFTPSPRVRGEGRDGPNRLHRYQNRPATWVTGQLIGEEDLADGMDGDLC